MTRARLATVALALMFVLAAIYFGIHWHQASEVRNANELGRSRQWAEAARVASRVQDMPERVPALLVRARALRANGQFRAADRAFARAGAEDPSNWIVYRDWGLVIDYLGDRRRAASTYARALALNPRLKLPPLVVRGRSAG